MDAIDWRDDDPTFERFARRDGGPMPTAKEHRRKAASKRTHRDRVKSESIGRERAGIRNRRHKQ